MAQGTRVGIDGSILVEPGGERGLGRYATALIQANCRLGNEVVPIRTTVPPGRVTDFLRLVERGIAISRRQVDLYHAVTPYHAAAPTRTPTITSILDLAPLDLPGYAMTGAKAALVFRMARKSDAILTLSQFSAKRIVRRLSISPERIVVAPLPPSSSFIAATSMWDRPQLELPFVVSMAPLTAWDTRKRIHWLAQLADALAEEGVRTYLVGSGTERAQRIGLSRNLVGLGHLSDEEWKHLVGHASAYIATTAYEGQGLPVLEALSTGTPIVGYANSAIAEVVGEAGLLLPEPFGCEAWARMEDPLSNEALHLLSESVAELIRDDATRRELSAKALRRASCYTEAYFQSRVDDAYQAVRK